jgi:hypothetical protein
VGATGDACGTLPFGEPADAVVGRDTGVAIVVEGLSCAARSSSAVDAHLIAADGAPVGRVAEVGGGCVDRGVARDAVDEEVDMGCRAVAGVELA